MVSSITGRVGRNVLMVQQPLHEPRAHGAQNLGIESTEPLQTPAGTPTNGKGI